MANKSNNSSVWDYILLLFGVPFVITGLLLIMATASHVISPAKFTGSYDSSFFIHALEVSAGYILTFLIVAYIFKQSLRKISRAGLALILAWFVVVQMFWRIEAVGLGHIDCGNSCVDSIIPEKLDNSISWIVLTALVLLAVMVFLKLRDNTRSSPLL